MASDYPTMHHYSATPVTVVRVKSPSQSVGAFKPSGLWLSDDSDFGWAKWCDGESFGDYSHRYEVTIDAPERLLWLRDVKAIGDFVEEYCEKTHGMPWPKWERVAERYAGVAITPYQWSLRLADGFLWYYSWDCASAVIWDGSVISGIREVTMIEPWIKEKKR